MIKVRKMGGQKVVINADLIESVKATPDTVITLTTGKKIIVEDSVEEIVDRAVEYYRRVSLPFTQAEEE